MLTVQRVRGRRLSSDIIARRARSLGHTFHPAPPVPAYNATVAVPVRRMRTSLISVLSCKHPNPAPGTNFACKQGDPLCFIWHLRHAASTPWAAALGLPSASHLVAANLPNAIVFLHLVCARAQAQVRVVLDADGPALFDLTSPFSMASKHARPFSFVLLQSRGHDTALTRSLVFLSIMVCTPKELRPSHSTVQGPGDDIMKHTSSMEARWKSLYPALSSCRHDTFPIETSIRTHQCRIENFAFCENAYKGREVLHFAPH
ncbi:hypothetical protein OH77DRAFT_221135 [Trametes cingulata]|nr:hypothetical protein OH77DRAFT_221135 [Trametes cingulata]